MPKSFKLSKAEAARLATLPRVPDLILEGGTRTLPGYVRDGTQVVQPQMVLWLDARQGVIRANSLLNPLQATDGGTGQAIESLVTAMTGPFGGLMADPALSLPLSTVDHRHPQPPMAQPGLPARVRVEDAALAQAARAVLDPLGVPVEVVETIPVFEAAFQSLTDFLGADEDSEPLEPFQWDATTTDLQPLLKAAAAYWRRAPWTFMPDHPPVAVALGTYGPEDGVETLYASILGIAEEQYGIAFYYSLDGYLKTLAEGEELMVDDADIDATIELLRLAGVPVDEIPRDELRQEVGALARLIGDEGTPDPEKLKDLVPDSLVLFLDDEDDTDPTYLAWLEERGLKYPSPSGVPSFLRTMEHGESRQPNAREIRALTVALDAVNQFFTRHRVPLERHFPPDKPLTHTAKVSLGDATVTVHVTAPAPGTDWPEIEAEDAEDAEDSTE